MAAANENARASEAELEARAVTGSEAARVHEQVALEVELLILGDSAQSADSDANSLVPEAPTARESAEPDLSTRKHTHVAEPASFDVTLKLLGDAEAAIDARARMAWRFKAVTAAYKVLSPLCPTKQDRAELVSLMRKYESSLRAAAGSAPPDAKQVSDALHAQLLKPAVEELDRQLSKVEDKLLGIDESIEDDAFRMRWTKQQQEPKALLRYARFLATRRFNVGYRRDRFELIAQELLTGKLPNGTLALMPRSKAGPILRQLLRGLPRASTGAADRAAAIAYLRDSLDRLSNLGGAKQFFDSGYFLDVHGYKVSMHDQITHPEFLYLCVAVNVEIHNRLLSWSAKAGTDGKRGAATTGLPQLSELLGQLRAQEQQVQGVFANFRKPVSSGAPAQSGHKGKNKRQKVKDTPALLPAVGAALFLLTTLAANLYVLGVIHFSNPPKLLSQTEAQALSPLLVRASLDPSHKQLSGMLSRKDWLRMAPRERRAKAEELAVKLKSQGVTQAELFAYRTRAIQIDFGSVVYVDETQ